MDGWMEVCGKYLILSSPCSPPSGPPTSKNSEKRVHERRERRHQLLTNLRLSDRRMMEVIVYSSQSEVAVRSVELVDVDKENLLDVVQSAVGDHIRLYRPLVEQGLWSKGIGAVTGGTMSWRRLCERFLSEITDEDDAAALLETAAPFAVAILDDTEMIISPMRYDSDRSSCSSCGHTTMLALTEDSGGFLKRQRFASLKEYEETRTCYVEALRSARRDVDKLRGAQATGLLLNSRDTRRIKTAWAKLWRSTLQQREILATLETAAQTLSRILQGRPYEKKRRGFMALKAYVHLQNALRKGAAVSKIYELFEFQRPDRFRREFYRRWKLLALQSLAVKALFKRCFFSHVSRRTFSKWRSITTKVSSGLCLLNLVLERRHAGRLKTALSRWSAVTKGEIQREVTCEARQRAFESHYRSLEIMATQKCKSRRFLMWKRLTVIGKVAARSFIGIEKRLRTKKLRATVRKWRDVVDSEASRKRAVHRVASRVTHRKALGAWNAWREQSQQKHKVETSLRRVATYARRTRRDDQRRAMAAWRRGVSARTRENTAKRIFSSLVAASVHRDLKVIATRFRAWASRARDLRKAELVRRCVLVIGACGVAQCNRLRVLGRALALWKSKFQAYDRQLKAALRVAVMMKRCRLMTAWRTMLTSTKRTATISEFFDRRQQRVHRRLLRTALSKLRTAVHQGAKVDRATKTFVKCALGPSFRKWSDLSSSLKHQDHRSRVLTRILRRNQKKTVDVAFRTWRTAVTRRGVFLQKLERGLRKIRKYQERTALMKWRVSLFAILGRDAALQKLVNRKISDAVCTAWLKWLDVVDDKRDETRRLAGLASAIRKCGLAKGLERWRLVAEDIDRCERTRSILRRVCRRAVRPALYRSFRKWNNTGGGLQLALVAQGVQILKGVAKLRRRSSLARGFSGFVAHRDRQDALVRVDRLVTRRLLSTALRQWSPPDSSLRDRCARTTMARLFQKRIARRWQQWRLAVVESQKNRLVLSRALRRRPTRGVGEAFRKWNIAALKRARVLEKMRAFNYVAVLKQRRAFDAWSRSQLAADRLAVCGSSRAKRCLRDAVYRWRTAVDAQKIAIRGLRRIAGITAKRDRGRAFLLWTAKVQSLDHEQNVLIRALRSWRRRKVQRGFRSLEANVDFRRQRDRVLERTLRRRRSRRTSLALETWRRRTILARRLVRVLHFGTKAIQWTALRRWRDVLLRGRTRARLGSILQRLAVANVRTALRVWRDVAMQRKAVIARKELVTTQQMAAIQRVAAIFSGVQKLAVAGALGMWRSTVRYETALKCRSLRAILRKAAQRNKVTALSMWRRRVRLGEVLGGILVSIQRRQMAVRFESWLVETRLEAMANGLMTKLGERWARVRLWTAWARWRHQDRRLRVGRLQCGQFKKVLCRDMARRKAASFLTWRNVVKSEDEQRASKRRLTERRLAELKHLGRSLATNFSRDAFRIWKAVILETRRKETTLAKAVAIVAMAASRRDLLKKGFRALQLSKTKAVAVLARTLDLIETKAMARGFRLWQLGAVTVSRTRAMHNRGAPLVISAVSRCVMRRAFSRWESRTVTLACRDLAARTLVDVARANDQKPVSRAFALWRRQITLDSVRPLQLRLAAASGALATITDRVEKKAAGAAVKRAFATWRTALLHALGARILAVSLSAAADALKSVAFDTWSGAIERRKHAQFQLWINIERRILHRAWLHWSTHVEVARELSALQYVPLFFF